MYQPRVGLGGIAMGTRFLFAAVAAATSCLLATEGFAQKDPGVRGGLQNTGGGLQAQGIPIPHPPVISGPISGNELLSFAEGINRAGQLESTCDQCAMVTDGSPAVTHELKWAGRPP
jgi:hypothetical protein